MAMSRPVAKGSIWPAIPGMNPRAKTAPDESGLTDRRAMGSPCLSPIDGALSLARGLIPWLLAARGDYSTSDAWLAGGQTSRHQSGL